MPIKAKPWAHLYDRHWRARRAMHLHLHPLCVMCIAARGETVPATIADHITPHRGDPVLFAGPLQSLCKSCHDSGKQQLEKSGRISGVGLDGMPLDPAHHWRTEQKR